MYILRQIGFAHIVSEQVMRKYPLEAVSTHWRRSASTGGGQHPLEAVGIHWRRSAPTGGGRHPLEAVEWRRSAQVLCCIVKHARLDCTAENELVL